MLRKVNTKPGITHGNGLAAFIDNQQDHLRFPFSLDRRGRYLDVLTGDELRPVADRRNDASNRGDSARHGTPNSYTERQVDSGEVTQFSTGVSKQVKSLFLFLLLR